MLEASRDLGADRLSSFRRVTLPLCRPTIIAAVLLTCLPMLGDYFTNDLLSASPKTAMVGNLINDSVQAPGQTGQAGAFVMLVFLAARAADALLHPRHLAAERGVSREVAHGVVERPVAATAVPCRDHRSATWSGRCCRCSSRWRSRSTTAGRGPTWQGFSFRWYWGDPTLSVWHDDALHTALLQTLKLGVIATLITVPLGVLFAIGIDRWRGRLPAGANFLMLLSFVLPEVLLAVALLFVITTVALPVQLGTTAQVIGLVTFQVSYPAVLVRARLATIGPQYEEAAMDLGASPLGAVRRVIVPMLVPGDLRQHRSGVRRRHRRLRAGAVPVRRCLHRAGVGEDLQHRPRRADAGAQRAGDACCCSPRWPPSSSASWSTGG